MLSDPCIFVTCDYCGYEDEVPLTSNGLGGYDDHNVVLTISAWGWIADNDYHVCPECVAIGRGTA